MGGGGVGRRSGRVDGRPGAQSQCRESASDQDARSGKRILDGDELLSDLRKLVVKVLLGHYSFMHPAGLSQRLFASSA